MQEELHKSRKKLEKRVKELETFYDTAVVSKDINKYKTIEEKLRTLSLTRDLT